MIKKLEEFEKCLGLAGFKNVSIKNVEAFFKLVRGKFKNVAVQFFDADLIAGWEHLYFATLNALTSFKNELSISKNLAVETLLFASAQRQIVHAVKTLGIKPDSTRIAVLVIGKTSREVEDTLKALSDMISGERDDNVLKLNDQKFEKIKDLFGISDLELKAKLERKGLEKQALKDLVIEHVALLGTHR